MNGAQLQAMLWLRWRLTRNQWRRGGTLNAVIMFVVTAACLTGAVVGGVAGVAIGALALGDAPPLAVMVVWDVLVMLFLFSWAIGLLTELQRSELLDVSRMLHLPVSVQDVFVLNYVASNFSPSVAMTLPAMLGLTVGLVLGRGPAMVLLVPLVLGFFFMITAWTYCLRGWLAALMVNKRRRRAIVMGVTMAIVLAAQLPNLVTNVWLRHEHVRPPTVPPVVRQPVAPIPRIEPVAPVAPMAPLVQEPAVPAAQEPVASSAPKQDPFAPVVEAVHRWVPLLWLPLGARVLAEGRAWPALLCSIGMLAIGAWGMIRAYRGTVRFYRGGETNRPVRQPARAPSAAPSVGPAAAARRILVERVLPAVPEQAAAMALAGLRSMLRAPEIKMALATNVLIFAILGASMFFSAAKVLPAAARPFVACAAVAMTLLGMAQVMFNHFGFDRDGFRTLVLLPAPRRWVLLGKNLAMLPMALVVFAIYLGAAIVLARLGVWDILAALLDFVAAILAISVLGNVASILVPYHIAAGSMKPTKMNATTGLLVFLSHSLMMITMLPVFLPAAAGLLGNHLAGLPAGPLMLACAAGSVVVSAVFYWQTLGPLGRLLQRREQKILQVVTREVE